MLPPRRQSYNKNDSRSCSQQSQNSYQQPIPSFYKNSNQAKNIINFNNQQYMPNVRKLPNKIPQHTYQHQPRNSSISDRTNIPNQENNKQNILKKLSLIQNVSDVRVRNQSNQNMYGSAHNRRQSVGYPYNIGINNQNDNDSYLMRSSSQSSNINNVYYMDTSRVTKTNNFQARSSDKNRNQYNDNSTHIKYSIILERLQKAQKQIQKLTKKTNSLQKSPKTQPQLQQIKQIYIMFRDNKKNQAKINDDNYVQLQNIKKTLQQIKMKQKQNPRQDNVATTKCINIHKNQQQNQLAFNKYQQIAINLQKQLHKLQIEFTNKIQSHQKLLTNFQNKYRLNLYLQRKQSIYSTTPIKETQHKNNKISIQQCTPITAQQSFIDFAGNRVKIDQIVYYVDQNGYLLDNNLYYIVDHNLKCIKLTSQQIQTLRSCNRLYKPK